MVQQVQLHCFALDGVSQHLFAPYGTDSLGDAAGLEMVKEQLYHESNRENWLAYYAPKLASVLLLLSRPRPSPLANGYVLETSKRSGAAEYSLISKLQSKASELEPLSAAGECMDNLAAGIDTTGDGLCFLMYQLSLPESAAAQSKLRQELVTNPDVQFDRLEYLDAVVKEGLRCFPPIPMSFPRYAPPGGTTLDGYFVPEHTIVSCQPYTLHKDVDVFPDPHTFKPERWLDPKGEIERNRLFFAFSQGGRGCIGKQWVAPHGSTPESTWLTIYSLAMAEMKLLLREVYSQCKTTVSEHMKGSMELSDQIISSRPKGQVCKLVFERATST